MKNYAIKIAAWTFIGLAIRLAIMPFTIHGQDLVFINYFPMMLVKNGIWDPYGFIATKLPHFPYTYYGPALLMIMSAANFIYLKVLGFTSLAAFLEKGASMMFMDHVTADYVKALFGLDLFRNIFILKIPYLLFDIATGAFLLKLAGNKEDGIRTYVIWMLNIVVIHSAYAVGGFDVIPAFFITTALYAAVLNRPYLCISLLSVGGAVKILPYLLVLPGALLLGDSHKKKVSLLATAILVSAASYLPFVLSSGKAVFGFLLLTEAVHYPGQARVVLSASFFILYLAICVSAFKESSIKGSSGKLIYYFMAILLISYTAFPVRFRYFVSVTPLLALIIPRHKKFGFFIMAIVMMLAFLWLTGRELQMGLFAPLGPDYFLGIPTLQEFIGRFVDIEICYKVTARVLIIALFAAAFWVWRIRSSDSKQRPVL